ncbi:DUF799 family lipoprotein [Campylobacter sp. RM12327]|uniref:DUF799 domain-containing protein n=1 Tax=Campylobacter sputorum TaxID=206 RepID=UPI000B7726E9|nr:MULTISPECIES: GNA1162 family protein [Campylobacter]ASM39351.1 putative lipoprotein (DUF799 domain) [Campylobacter sputorum]MBE7358797.1 DUF799 family lipoprotein [Campylobacter sp. RM11302]MBF6670101.1 DUF799 family lipoprotein [Campylobacter sp. RM12327]MBF6675214.1 DUF799 family lipoprotein [Campylobacter sp. RM13538]MBF6676825.1 DUF799 family lipoprotein [Campylobacter sp. RM12321]
MRFKFLIFLSFLTLFLFSGCATKEPDIYDYSNFLQSRPKSILVVMPKNESLEPKAATAILANAILPLSEAGYYVFPVTLVNETFKSNGIFSGEDIAQIPLNKLREIYLADSVLFIDVKDYGSRYALLDTQITIEISVKLIDLNNGNLLWDRSEKIIQSASNGNNNIIGMFITAMVAQVVNTVTDNSYNVAKTTDFITFSTDCYKCILHGHRSPNFGKDKQLSK